MLEQIKEAFQEVRGAHKNYSADVIILHAELNNEYVLACRRKGLSDDVFSLNWKLFNARKAGKLSDLPKSILFAPESQEEYIFASEIAARFIESKMQVSLDRILCHPNKRRDFDSIAQKIAPGFTEFQYRWAALNLRKKRRLRPENIQRAVEPVEIDRFSASEAINKTIPTENGIYIFQSAQETLYIGQTENLRSRITKHLDHSDNKGLARWLWDHNGEDLYVEYHVLKSKTNVRVRTSYEKELISSRKPNFNIQV